MPYCSIDVTLLWNLLRTVRFSWQRMLAGSAGVEYIRMGGWLRGSSVIVTNSMSDTGIESDSVEDERLKRHGAADEGRVLAGRTVIRGVE
jgi:hypothetical protein